MKTLLVTLMVLFFLGLVFGQLDPDPDGIGIYFDSSVVIPLHPAADIADIDRIEFPALHQLLQRPSI